MYITYVIVTCSRVVGKTHSLQDEILRVTIDVVDLCLQAMRTQVLVVEKSSIEVVAAFWLEVWVALLHPMPSPNISTASGILKACSKDTLACNDGKI